MHHGFAVDADLRELLFDGTEMKGSELAKAGVVDENVDGNSGAFSGVVNLLRGGWVVEVGNDDADFGSLACKFGGQRFEAVFAACGEDEFGAVAGEFARDCYTDA
jgi:hypothetical protein